MAGDTRKIKVNVTIDSDTRGSDDAATSLEKVDKAAGGAEEGLAGLKKESEKLDVQLAKSKTKVKELEAELIRTGDSSTGRGSLRSRLGQERRWLQELERLSKDAAAAGSAGASAFSSAFQAGTSTTNILPEHAKAGLIAGLAVIALEAAPAIGAIISGAVAGTVAGAGIAGGVIAASRDSRVQAAFKDLTSEFTAEAFGGEAFVQPVVKGIGILKEAFRDLHIDEVLAKGASSVPILADGLAALVTNIMPGFNRVMDQAEAFTTVFADGLAGTGTAISDFLSSLMDSEGTIEGLEYGFKLLNGTITATGNILQWLGDAFHKMVRFSAWLTGGLEDVVRVLEDVARSTTQVLTFGMINLDDNHGLSHTISWMNDAMERTKAVGWGASTSVHGLADAIKRLPDPTEEETRQLKDLNDEMFRTATAGMAVDAAADNLAASFMDLADSVAENGTSLDQWDQQGNKNRQTIRGLLGDLEAQRQANIANGMAVGDANALFTEQANILQQKLTTELGFASDAVAGLIGQYKNIPTVVTTEFRQIYTQDQGHLVGEHSGVGDNRDRSGFQQFAAGGVVKGPAGSAQLVIAHGGERVLTQAQQDWTGSGMGGGASAGTSATPLNLYGGGLGQIVFEWLRTEIAAKGGTLAVLGLRA